MNMCEVSFKNICMPNNMFKKKFSAIFFGGGDDLGNIEIDGPLPSKIIFVMLSLLNWIDA